MNLPSGSTPVDPHSHQPGSHQPESHHRGSHHRDCHHGLHPSSQPAISDSAGVSHHSHPRTHRPDEHHPHPAGITGFLHGLFEPHSHDAADSIDDALEASAAGVRVVKMSLLALMATAALQLVVVALSGSMALLADTVHNFADGLTSVPLWVAFVLGQRAASRRYTYGYGRVEDLAGLFIVAMIALSAVVTGVESVRRLIHPQPLTNLGWVLVAGLIGFAGNELVATFRIRVGRRIGSAALVADGMHARADGFTSLAVVGGVIGVWAGVPRADPLIGIVISIAIAVLLIGAARDVGRRLLDGVDPELIYRAEQAIAAVPGIVAVDQVRMRWTGHRLIVEATVCNDPELPVGRFHELEHEAADAIRERLPSVGAVRLSPSTHPADTAAHDPKQPHPEQPHPIQPVPGPGPRR